MKLFYSPTSPFARKALVLARETGQLDDLELIAAGGNPLDPGTMPTAHNPLGKIPALVLDDGSALFDSRVICRYLDARAGNRLYPQPPHLWQCLTLEALADGMVDAAILMVYESRLRDSHLQMESWIEGQWAKITRALDALEGSWIEYLGGPLCMGQIALGCALSYIDFRHDSRNWRKNHPRLADWERNLATRDSMKATMPAE